jgi:hypothetical protein
VIDRTFQAGQTWVYREKAHTVDCPVFPAEIIQLGPSRSNKIRVRFLGGEYPGLDQWVPKVRLQVPWDQVDAWQRDDQFFARAWQASQVSRDSVEYEAAFAIFAVYTNVDLGWNLSDGATVRIANLDKVASELGFDVQELLEEPLAFVDRFGEYVAAWPTALRLAQRVAARFPDRVTEAIAAEERELQEQAIMGHTYYHSRIEDSYIPPDYYRDRLKEMEPVFALTREWCGSDAVERFSEVDALRQEMARLRELVEEAARELEWAGKKPTARRIRNKMAPVSGDPDRKPRPRPSDPWYELKRLSSDDG